MEPDLDGIVIIAGAYGSGKTEVAINLAVNRKRAGYDVKVADLDLVNPYFRTREAAALFNRWGIELIVPAQEWLQADLPILSPAVSGLIRQAGQLTILDAGGDDAGATVLAALADAFVGKTVRMLQVVNPYRPTTDTIDKCLQIKAEIEAASGIAINGLVSNANLMDETTADDLYSGYDFVSELSRLTNLPIEFVTAAQELLPELNLNRFLTPVLPIVRQLTPPWRKAGVIKCKN
ncbi:cobalamin biosynthesis protein CbiA [Desulfococcaceae bacterium HSG9]|nr:cobalamin biosynthesis protein CbiA [Desulfococcaceae bacterium HSG9]